jgi:hypothetical protein
MDRKALHRELRNALGLADELGRCAHAFGNDATAATLAVLRTVLAELERSIGGRRSIAIEVSHPAFITLSRARTALEARRGEFPREHHFRLDALLAEVDRLAFALDHPLGGVPSKTIHLRRTRLPLFRVVPQNVHAVADWLLGLACIGSAAFGRTRAARAAGLGLGAASATLSLLTDEHLSPVRRVRIEAHEVLDYVWGAAAIGAPFVLGYGFRKSERLATALSVVAGVVSIASALLTDYWAESGVSSPMRSRGGPRALLRDERA